MCKLQHSSTSYWLQGKPCFASVRLGRELTNSSTGGILALGLGVENWNLDKCEHHFEDLMQRAFVARDLSKIPVLESIYKHKGKYKTKIFVDGLQDLFGNSQLLFGGKSDRQRFRRNVAVMSTTEAGQKAVVLSNYNRPSKDAEAS